MSTDRMEKCVQGLCARFKKTADEMKAELNFAAVLVFCGASCVWSLYQILCDLASSINGHILGAKRTTEKELSK
jgi:hypothetical protein